MTDIACQKFFLDFFQITDRRSEPIINDIKTIVL